MFIKLKPPKAIKKMRRSNQLVAETFAMLGEHIQPGVTTLDLDRLAEEFIRKHGALPLYKGYKGSAKNHPPFPGTICASVNEQICHGIPNETPLKEGDIVGIDIGLRLDDWCGDACYTYPVGKISAKAQKLLDITQECMNRGIAAAQEGRYLGEIGDAIEDYADAQGVTVVREWGGHGIGRALHESPSVSHVRQPEKGPRLRPGMVFTIEPMINAGGYAWNLLDDGWTVVTRDGKLSAQFEHTIAITDNGTEILSQL